MIHSLFSLDQVHSSSLLRELTVNKKKGRCLKSKQCEPSFGFLIKSLVNSAQRPYESTKKSPRIALRIAFLKYELFGGGGGYSRFN